MQVLEKILKEMRQIKDGNRKENLYAKYPPNGKDQEVLNEYSQGYEDGTDNFYNAVVHIIRKHMNDGWIPVERGLPEEKGVYLVSYHPCYWDNVDSEVEVGIDTFRGKTAWAKKKFQRVVAWQPLPEPYRPERSEE